MQTYTDFKELPIIYRGDDEATMKPYGGVATMSDGCYILASRKRGRLAIVSPDGLVLSSCDPLNGHVSYDKLMCYGIALSSDEQSLYMLVGVDGGTDLYVSTIEVIPPRPVGHGNEHSDPVFRWLPASDVRLPSTAARSTNYDTFPSKEAIFSYPDLYGFLLDYDSNGNEIYIPAGPYKWDIRNKKPIGVPGNFLYWDRSEEHHAYWVWNPIDINDWIERYGSSIFLDRCNTLGPILVDCPLYKPCMVSVGSRVMVGCTHVQLCYANTYLVLHIEPENEQFGSVPKGELRQAFFDWLLEIMQKVGLVSEPDETVDDESAMFELIGPETKRHWLDVFREGFWWQVDEETRTVSVKLSFQMGMPASSVVTVNPELGTIDGIFNVTMFYPIPHMMSDDRDITLFLYNYRNSCSVVPQFWEEKEFFVRYVDNPNPTPIDTDFYLRFIEYFITCYKGYIDSGSPLSQARGVASSSKSHMTWEDPVFFHYATTDEATLAVYAPTFE